MQNQVASQDNSITLKAASSASSVMHSLHPGPSIAMFAHAGIGPDVRPHFAKTNFKAPIPMRTKGLKQIPAPNLPPSIIALNAQRKANAWESIRRPKTAFVPLPPGRPTCFNVNKASTTDLRQGLKYLLSSNAMPSPDLAKDVNTWIRLVENSVDSWMVSQSTDLVDLLIDLNNGLEEAPGDRRRTFYNTSSAAGIDASLMKLVERTRSVRVEKEVEDFEDTREDWLASTTR